MGLRLLVNRVEVPQPGFSAMLWTEDADARLIEWKEFAGTVTLGVWLARVVGKYGRGNIKIDWTPQLMADARLRGLITSILAPPAPPDAVPRVRPSPADRALHEPAKGRGGAWVTTRSR